MPVIEVKDFNESIQNPQKGTGLSGAVKGLFHPQHD